MNDLMVGASLRELTEDEAKKIVGGETAVGGDTHEGGEVSDSTFWHEYQRQLIFGRIGGV